MQGAFRRTSATGSGPVLCPLPSAHSNLHLHVSRQAMAMRSPSAVALRLQARSLVRRWARGLSDSVTYDASSTDVEAMIEENLVSVIASRRCRRRRHRRCRACLFCRDAWQQHGVHARPGSAVAFLTQLIRPCPHMNGRTRRRIASGRTSRRSAC